MLKIGSDLTKLSSRGWRVFSYSVEKLIDVSCPKRIWLNLNSDYKPCMLPTAGEVLAALESTSICLYTCCSVKITHF